MNKIEVIRIDEVSKITINSFCKHHNNNCFKCAYKLIEKQGLWCRVEGKYIYKYKLLK